MLKTPTNDKGDRTYGSGSGTQRLYFVEARQTCAPQLVIPPNDYGAGGFILDHEWRRVPEEAGSRFIVPVSPLLPPTSHDGLMNEQAALAFAHLFLAILAANFRDLCVECRLVEVKYEWTYTTTETGVGEIINRSDGPNAKYQKRETEDIPLSARHEKAAA